LPVTAGDKQLGHRAEIDREIHLVSSRPVPAAKL
jgi:hypothetical protein